MAGPVGRLNATCNGRIARIRKVPLPRESQVIQEKKTSQHAPERTSVDTITRSLQAYSLLPASWRANTSSVEAARSSTAPKKSTFRKDCNDILVAFLSQGQNTRRQAVPTSAQGALYRYIHRQSAFVVITPPRIGPASLRLACLMYPEDFT